MSAIREYVLAERCRERKIRMKDKNGKLRDE